MKAMFVFSLVLMGSTLAGADNAPPEIVAARVRYEAALSAASLPVRTKYLAELEQIKSRALAAKNLQLAVAAEEEIKALSAAVATAAGGSLQGQLINTTWTWGVPGKTVTFLPDGKADVDKNAVYTWAVVKTTRPVVEVRWVYGGEQRSVTFTFSQSLKSAKAVMTGGKGDEWESKPVQK
jgi:hypothetical protein